MPNETSGGSSDTEVNEVAVKPAGGAPGAVTTTTPAAWWRSRPRNRSGSTADWFVGTEVTVMLRLPRRASVSQVPQPVQQRARRPVNGPGVIIGIRRQTPDDPWTIA